MTWTLSDSMKDLERADHKQLVATAKSLLKDGSDELRLLLVHYKTDRERLILELAKRIVGDAEA